MTLLYQENPVLLVNSYGPRIASGRNVRAQHRSQQAASIVTRRKQSCHFGVFEVEVKSEVLTIDSTRLPGKRGRWFGQEASTSVENGPSRLKKFPRASLSTLQPRRLDVDRRISSSLSISEVLAYANFHIRLNASMAVVEGCDRQRLTQILLRRQWACTSLKSEQLARSHVLQRAFECVAAKVGQLNHAGASSFSDLLVYDEALQMLQEALRDPAQHDHTDLVTTVQLLAMYEMLNSFDRPDWERHVAGLKLLAQPGAIARGLEHLEGNLPCTLTIPMVAEIFLTGENEPFTNDYCGSPGPLSYTDYISLLQSSHEYVNCLSDLPKLIADGRAFSTTEAICDPDGKHKILERAASLRLRLRQALLKPDEHEARHQDKIGTPDTTGLCLAGLIVIDRLIGSISSIELSVRKLQEARTDEFCARMLHMDLGAVGAYVASDLMDMFRASSFPHPGTYVIVFPGCNDD